MFGPAFSRLAIGIDPARGHEHIVDRVSRLPLSRGAHVALIHALPPEAERDADSVSLSRLRALGAILLARRADVIVEAVVRRGERAAELALAADGSRSELLVVGRGPRRAQLGMRTLTTAERASRRTDVPVLAVRPGAPFPYRGLLAAIESPARTSARSIETARRLLDDGAFGGDLVHVLDDGIERRLHRAGAPWAAVVMARRWLRSRLRTEIGEWLEGLGRLGLHVRLERGDPSRVILDLAERARPDLLVLGADDRWLRGRLLRPSVAGVVLARAHCDVLIVRTSRTRSLAERSTRAAA